MASCFTILSMSLEWCLGYDIRFGVTFTDYDTLERTPKESALKIGGMIEGRMDAKGTEGRE